MSEDMQKVRDLLKIRGCSDRTTTNYLSCINRFKNYYELKGVNLKELKEADILEYIKVNCINIGFSAATINVNRAAIKYYYLVNFDIDFNKSLLPSCKTKSRFPILLSKKEVINAINSENNLKHKLWLLLGYGSGLRTSEVAELKVSDIKSSEHKIRVVGKGNKERYVPLPDITLKLLRIYWKTNKDKITNDFLFPGIYKKTKDTHINPNTIKEAFKKIRENNNFDKSVTFHTLRHSFATEYIKSGGNIWELKSLLGHSSVNTTMIYLHMAEDFSKVPSPLDGVDNV